MRILALDHGTVRIGVATSDELKMIARPVEFIAAEPFSKFIERLRELIRELQVEQILIGMPRNMDGSYGEAAAKVRVFIAALKDVIAVPIRTWDERLTTVSASKALRSGGTRASDQRGKIDAASSAVLLQGYLDSLTP
ncbi:MAG: Holliday junction resolvase RuvX [Pedosphaera sp.]|nr:Holliday junction resolvase RuvX [Pedosphaera sp.]